MESSDPAVEKGAMTLRRMGKPLGATFLGIAILVLLIGINRYYESQNWLLKGKFPASRGSIVFLTVIAAAVRTAFDETTVGCDAIANQRTTS
ncbi:hypothetical protein TWF103_001701 [Orbilia oligospora]|nr:hypothetical protein TWF103_001701 [Orbilia oligospora]